MAKRRRFSRWRRLPGVYRIGDDKPPRLDQELQKLTIYIAGGLLDHAEDQAARLGYGDAQQYCTSIVVKAIEGEALRTQMADLEARHGMLEGLNEIADDPDFLAEMRAASSPRQDVEPLVVPAVPVHAPISVRISGTRDDVPPLRRATSTLSAAAEVVLRHAGRDGADDDPSAFLPALRRGESVPPTEVAELAQALHQLERESRGETAMDRRLVFALHRLAFESQILHTDAWPGSFDAWTVDMLRAVQEAVERILSGEDIRYFPDGRADSSAPGVSPEFPR